MPREQRDRIERLDELHGFLHQSIISGKNLLRLKALCRHADAEVATLAALILDIARVFPGKRNRWLKLARQRPELFERVFSALGAEFFEDLLAGYGDFDSPLWEILRERRIAPPWTARPCDCGSGGAFRDCCLGRENALMDDVEAPSALREPRQGSSFFGGNILLASAAAVRTSLAKSGW